MSMSADTYGESAGSSSSCCEFEGDVRGGMAWGKSPESFLSGAFPFGCPSPSLAFRTTPRIGSCRLRNGTSAFPRGFLLSRFGWFDTSRFTVLSAPAATSWIRDERRNVLRIPVPVVSSNHATAPDVTRPRSAIGRDRTSPGGRKPAPNPWHSGRVGPRGPDVCRRDPTTDCLARSTRARRRARRRRPTRPQAPGRRERRQ
jgi:hypothetical protein